MCRLETESEMHIQSDDSVPMKGLVLEPSYVFGLSSDYSFSF